MSTGYRFEEFMDGVAWTLGGPEGRSSDFDAALYETWSQTLATKRLSAAYWHEVLTTTLSWASIDGVSSESVARNTERLASAGITIADAAQQGTAEVARHGQHFADYDADHVVSLYRVLAAVVSPDLRPVVPLLAHAIAPVVYPLADPRLCRIETVDDYRRYVQAVQGGLQGMGRPLVEILSGLVTTMAQKVKGSLAAGVIYPQVTKVAHLCELGRAHPSALNEFGDTTVPFQGMGTTVRDVAAFVATLLTQTPSGPLIPESLRHRFVKGTALEVDLPREIRNTPEPDPSFDHQTLLGAKPFLEGVLYWLYRARAPRDFNLHTYQMATMFAAEDRALTDEHIDVALRALSGLRFFVSEDLDVADVRRDLVNERDRLYGEYLRSIRPYAGRGQVHWIDWPSKTDGSVFFDIVRGLPSVSSDTDASWICHLLCPSSFAPLPDGGEHFLRVVGYPAYNAKVKDLFFWSLKAKTNLYDRAALVLGCCASGRSPENMGGGLETWPIASLAVFLGILGVTHPGVAQQLVDEGTPALEGHLIETHDFLTAALMLESYYQATEGWFNAGVLDIIASIHQEGERAVVDAFCAPTEIFSPGRTMLQISGRQEPRESLTLPVRLVNAPATKSNFKKEVAA